MTDDLFTPAVPDSEIYGIRAGRYRFPAPPGEQSNPRGFYRMTNLVSAFSDQERLQLWLTWKMMMGLRADDGLVFDEWMATNPEALDEQAQRALANDYAEKARERAGSKDNARRGTARHSMMDAWFTAGAAIGTRAMQFQRDTVLEILDAAELDVLDSEFKVWHSAAGGTMGTSDARVLCRRTGQVGILDWKTQMRFWTFQEIAGQLYGYDSAPWMWVGPESAQGYWVPVVEDRSLLGHPDGEHAGKRVALVMHMPLAGAPELYEVDLEYGKAVLETAARNVELRSIGKSTALGRRPAGIRPR